MNPTHYLACDLGAESGRVMLATLDAGRIALTELHRFANVPLQQADALCWDIPRLFAELKTGLRLAAARRLPIAGLSVDSWGLDYLLLDEHGELLAPTFHYRDARNLRGIERVRAALPWETVYEETGIQFMQINTLYQLAAEPAERLQRARQLLPMADGFHFLLSGVARAEVSLASTTQVYNPRTRDWSEPLLRAFDLPRALFPPIVPCGTRLGPLLPAIAAETGLGAVPVIASCSHDTAAAVAAVPAEGDDWAYLSSGTWSLIGVELPAPVINAQSRRLNFTNEMGVGHTTRLLRNVIGLWLVQECRRAWAAEGNDLDYDTLTQLAAASPPFAALINPADERFFKPDHMPRAIAQFCSETGQPAPATPSAFIRCALESLALLYCRRLREVEQLTQRRVRRVHIVGGGSKNALLNQFTADATGCTVLAGPAEATALGNALVQALALGHLQSLAAARAVVRRSFAPQVFEPRDRAAWAEAAARFQHIAPAEVVA